MLYNSPGANIPVSNYYTQGMTAPPVGLLGPGDFPSVDTSGLLGFTPISIPDLTGGLSSSKFDVAASIEAQEAAKKKKNGNRPEGEGTQWGGGSQPDGEQPGGSGWGKGTHDFYGAKHGQLSHSDLAHKYGAAGLKALIDGTSANFVNSVSNALTEAGIEHTHKGADGKLSGKYSAADFAEGQRRGIFD